MCLSNGTLKTKPQRAIHFALFYNSSNMMSRNYGRHLFICLHVVLSSSVVAILSSDVHEHRKLSVVDLMTHQKILAKLANTHSSRSLLTASVDFSNFAAGDVVNDLGDGITVVALKHTSKGLVSGSAMIFDSTIPTGEDADLGTPNMAFGGPGIGKAGKPNKLFPNMVSKGNIIIISEDNDSADPDDNASGGEMHFYFNPPRFLASVGLLDNEEGMVFNVVTSDGGGSIYINGNGGNNSFEQVVIGKPSVKQLVVTFGGSGAITDLQFEPSSCPTKKIDFSAYRAGDLVVALVSESLSTSVDAYDTDGKPALAMIFDSSNPTGGDIDLGTPHKSFKGPGVGKAGKKGKLFQNSAPKGNVLIISENGDASNPDDSKSGGFIVFNFSEPCFLDTVGLLDNDESTLFSITSSDGSESHTYNENGGNNSFELVKIGKPAVTQLVVTFGGSGAVTEVNVCIQY